MNENQDLGFYVSGIVGMMSGEALVRIECGSLDIQVSTEKARELAMMLLAGAEAAEQDLITMKFFMEDIKLDQNEAAKAVAGLRKHRPAQGRERP